MTTSKTSVAVVGAGPYGLSVSAHLTARGVEHRIFGRPMSLWAEHMANGTFLKSEGHASSLSAPDGRDTLREYAQRTGLPYADTGRPVPVETFIDYGRWFQQSRVPHLDEREIASLTHAGTGYELGLSDGTAALAERVVLAIGVQAFLYVPPVLAGLSGTLVSHTVDHRDLRPFADRDVVVLGAGQSALETAALLNEAGARVRVLVRGDGVIWGSEPSAEPTLLRHLRYPRSSLGAGWRIRFYANQPAVFHRLPKNTRIAAVRSALGPAGSWWLRDRVEDVLPVTFRSSVRAARSVCGAVRLTVRDPEGTTTLDADHVMAGTGYRVDLDRLAFLDVGLRQQIATFAGYPLLDGAFRSSLPGLSFVGLAAAGSFGPVQRFVAGAGFAARRVAASLS